MHRFAFLCHPLDFHQLANLDSGVARKSPRLIRQVMAQVPPSHVRTVEITSPTGAKAIAEMICVWLLPDQFRSLDERLVRAKLVEALEIARGLECQLVGLGAYTKIAAFSYTDAYANFPFAVTTGNTFTSALAVRAMQEVMGSRELLRETTEVAVVGAAGAIGNAVLRAIAPQVGKVNLAGRNLEVLEKIAGETRSYGCEVEVCLSAKHACREADLVLLATSEPGLLIQAADLSYGAAVIDVSKPVNILPDASRPDVAILDCAMVQTPARRMVQNHVQCFPLVEGLDSPEVFACFAESMILALEGRFEAYSSGRTLDIRKFDEILNLGRKHGFSTKVKVGPWKSASLPASTKLMLRSGIAS